MNMDIYNVNGNYANFIKEFQYKHYRWFKTQFKMEFLH